MFYQDAIYLNDDFKNSLSKYCDDLFIDANLIYYENRTFKSEGDICWIDLTNYISANDGISVVDKVKFCVAWLHTIPIKDGDMSCYGIVHIDGKDFDSWHYQGFISYMQQIGIISQKEHSEIYMEWLDITNGEPYYTLS